MALLVSQNSATGIFRRHPDVLHRITDKDIADRAALQAELIRAAAAAVRPGGTLVYATCSLERAEGEDVVAAFLAEAGDWRIEPVSAGELPDGIVPDEAGTVRLMPPMLADVGGLDGFYIARLVRG